MPARRRVVAASGVVLLALLMAGAPAGAAKRDDDRTAERTTTTAEHRRTTTTDDPPRRTTTTEPAAAAERATTSTTRSRPTSTTSHATTTATSVPKHTEQSSSNAGTSTSTTARRSNGKRYVVVLKKGNLSRPVADDHARSRHVKVERVFGHAIRGYAGDIPDDELDAIKHDKRVAYVQRDKTMRAYAQILPWGVEKVSRNGDDWSSTRPGDGTGAVNMDVYILDSGVRSGPDLTGGTEFNSRGGALDDCAGHGTFTAAVVGALDDANGVVGVAPGVRLHGVRVLDCNGRGTTTDVVGGLDWIVAHGVKPAVVQMSFGAQTIDRAFDESITRAVNAGFVITDAAGNDHVDACKQSPAHMGTLAGVITVGATGRKDAPASFSNFGSCVDVWAPGVRVTSDFLNGSLAVGSGTSASAPHVAGVAALYLAGNAGASPSGVESAIKNAAVHIGRTRRPLLRTSSASF
jgi:hypothetical protein